MAHDIGVWLFGQSVGTLSLVNGRLSFQYHQEGLAQPNAVALSKSLPLVPEPFDDHQCRGLDHVARPLLFVVLLMMKDGLADLRRRSGRAKR